jgi:tagatose 1,6-diphosphate aldolase
MTSLSLGKRRGLQRLATPGGSFAMLAIDQRPPLSTIIAKARGVAIDEVTFDDMCAAKRIIVKMLAPEASAILLDPNFALPAAIDLVPPRTGLIVTLEGHRYLETPGGRKSRAISNWNVEKTKRLGADAVKVLAWYRPDAASEVVEHQKAFVESVGRDCREADIPYVLELLTYPLTSTPDHGKSTYEEFTGRSAQLVIDSIHEFVKPRYQVDMLKLESPVPATEITVRDRSEVRTLFEEMGKICQKAGIPWVMLSAGAAPEAFSRVLEYAFSSGSQGFLAGRSIWLDCLNAFPDLDACERCLGDNALRIFRALVDLAEQQAQAFVPDQLLFSNVKQEGDFARLLYGNHMMFYGK